ncbi:tryptophan 7-halogenase [Pseudomaricurvus alkylphenolicus]|uniref:tryptophan halogenase family protein n=1 Tax=Pseudomaricurvus alkylphenolicus TaxID=1306991 RepID=UPI00141DA2AD|nr:tryptophan halogenase family protein [Pseudomaricurvus alkylphenolicus]NIB42638.1 tryptophan 7-halogenase [Pseudomaricurvus alkylphenolicus]
MAADNNTIRNVIIAGGGTAGWMTAAALSSLIGKNLNITLIESDDIPVVGVGEATIPPLLTFHRLLKIDEQEFMRATQATFKLGINFENWREREHQYFHSFGTTGKDCWAATFHNFWLKARDESYTEAFENYCLEIQAARQNRFARVQNNLLNYAYHLDASLYAGFLRKHAEKHGVVRQEGMIDKVEQDLHSGDINALQLKDGTRIEGDLFVDCTGFRGLLIEQTLHAGYEDWSHWLPCDRAVAAQTELKGELTPYTRSIAHDSGWRWRIPLQTRVGNGLVYCSKTMSDEQARQTLLDSVDGELINEPRVIPFRAGRRRKTWLKNCVAIGLSSGFIEPLESTSIHLIQRAIIRLMQLFPTDGIKQPDVNEFNRQSESETSYIRDFIILHYKVTNRTDSEFWRYCKNMDVPDSLARKIDLFRECGRVFREDVDLFLENSWVQVMMGQGITPEQYHPIVDMMSEQEQRAFFEGIRSSVNNVVEQLPTHEQFLKSYCAYSAT